MMEECAAAKIDPEAREALWILDKPRMQAIVIEAQKIGLVI